MRLRAVISAVALVWMILGVPVTAAEPVEEGDWTLQEAIRFRTELGYEAAPSTVGMAITNASESQLGLPLSPGEEADFIGRSRLRDKLVDTVAFIEGEGGQFGGLYFDQTDGALVLNVVTLKDTSVAAVRDLHDTLPEGAVIRLVGGEFSMATLLQARDLLEPLVPEHLDMVAVDPVQNRVLVSGSSEGHRVALDVLGGLSETVSLTAPVIAEASACTSRLACTSPWRGGTRISQDGFNCTWGYNAKATSGTRFLITAGHCSRLNRNVSHNGAVVNIAPGVDINTFDMVASQFTDVLSAPPQVVLRFAKPHLPIRLNQGLLHHRTED